jgi:hypothetical protein
MESERRIVVQSNDHFEKPAAEVGSLPRAHALVPAVALAHGPCPGSCSARMLGRRMPWLRSRPSKSRPLADPKILPTMPFGQTAAGNAFPRSLPCSMLTPAYPVCVRG